MLNLNLRSKDEAHKIFHPIYPTRIHHHPLLLDQTFQEQSICLICGDKCDNLDLNLFFKFKIQFKKLNTLTLNQREFTGNHIQD